MQELIVFTIVALAVGHIARSFLKKYRGASSGDCGCDCSGCSQNGTCQSIMQETPVPKKYGQ